MALPYFLRQKDNTVYFNLKDRELQFFVPEDYFKQNSINIDGENINLLGLIEYAIVNPKTGKQELVKCMNFPSIFTCRPYTIEKQKQVKPTKNSQIDDYRILKFRYDDIVVKSIYTPQLITNVEEFFKMLFITAKIPPEISYDKLWELMEKNFNINGGSYNVDYHLLGIVCAEIARSKSNNKIPFRYTEMKNLNEYDLVSIKKLPDYNSPFSDISSENFDESLMASILMSKEDDKDIKDSPLEKIVM